MDEVTEKTVTEHTVTLKVRSDVDPAELLDIMIALSENIVEMVEQQCIECRVYWQTTRRTEETALLIKGEPPGICFYVIPVTFHGIPWQS